MNERAREGRRLLAFVAGLSGALAVLAKHPASEAVPAELRDALRDAVRGLEHLELALQEVARPGLAADDAFAASMPKILREVEASHLQFVTELSAWSTDSWAARRAELAPAERPAVQAE